MTKRISRRGILTIAGGAAVATAAGLTISKRPAAPKQPPNIVFIVSDAFRADRLGLLRAGRSISPNLDTLAAGSLVYDNCYSPSSWTKTSMACILTGSYPPYNSVLRPNDTIPKDCGPRSAHP